MSHHSDIFFAFSIISRLIRNSLKILIFKVMSYKYFRGMMNELETVNKNMQNCPFSPEFCFLARIVTKEDHIR
jgi:hypothetical protein